MVLPHQSRRVLSSTQAILSSYWVLAVEIGDDTTPPSTENAAVITGFSRR